MSASDNRWARKATRSTTARLTRSAGVRPTGLPRKVSLRILNVSETSWTYTKQTALEEARAASHVILTMSTPPQGRRCRGLGEGIRMTTSEPKRMAPRGSSCRGERKPGEQRDPRPESWEDWSSDIDMSEINNIMSIKGALSEIYE